MSRHHQRLRKLLFFLLVCSCIGFVQLYRSLAKFPLIIILISSIELDVGIVEKLDHELEVMLLEFFFTSPQIMSLGALCM
jgi:hypothetical protein